MPDVELQLQPTEETVSRAFREAIPCAGADNCLMSAQAICELTRLNNIRVMEAGIGKVMFSMVPQAPCPNQDQLFCQDR